MLMAAIGSGIYFLVGVAIVPRAEDFGIEVRSAAIPYGAAMLGMGFGGIAMGWFADRRGPFWPALVGSTAIALGAFLVSRADSFWIIVGIYALFLGALGNAAMVTPLFANATRWFERRRGVAVSMVGSGQALGGTFWPPLFHWAIESYGWRTTYFVYALFALALLVPLSFVFRRPTPVPAPMNAAALAALADREERASLGFSPNTVLAMLCVAVVGCCIAMSMPLVHLPRYVVERGFSLGQGASILGVLMATSVVSRIVWGFVCDRIGGLPTLFVTSSIQASALALMALTSSFGGLYGVAVFFGLGFGGILPCYPVILREHLPLEGIGWRVGMIVLFGAVGMAIGPEVAGRVYANTGAYSLGFAAGVAANLMNLSIVGLLNLRRLRAFPEPALA